MTAPAYEGEIRLGVPHDIVGPYLPPILLPLRQGLAAGARRPTSIEIHPLAAATRDCCGGVAARPGRSPPRSAAVRNGETLIEDELVWVGGGSGMAHGAIRCPFRSATRSASSCRSVLKALRRCRSRLAVGVRSSQHGAAARHERGRPEIGAAAAGARFPTTCR